MHIVCLYASYAQFFYEYSCSMLTHEFFIEHIIFALIENETDNLQFFDYIFSFLLAALTKYGAWAEIPKGRQTNLPHLMTKQGNFPHRKNVNI